MPWPDAKIRTIFKKKEDGTPEKRVPDDLKIDELPMPEGMDFSVLWEDPGQGGSLQMILIGVACALSFITLIVSIFK